MNSDSYTGIVKDTLVIYGLSSNFFVLALIVQVPTDCLRDSKKNYGMKKIMDVLGL